MKSVEIPLSQLLLDPNNYRLQDTSDSEEVPRERFKLDAVQKGTRAKLESEGLKELKRSIKANGFLPIERIVVAPYSEKPKLYYVIEGNRRVAALKSLQLAKADGAEIPDSLDKVFKGVPCILVDSEDEFPCFKETLMGIRHVGGIREWGGYQRAKLIADLINHRDLEPSEVADRLGLSLQEVNRRYRAFSALKQMAEDEDFADYANAELYPIFHEALALPNVRSWLGWDSDALEFENEENLSEFYTLITPQKDEETGKDLPPKIGSYGDVRELKRILGNAQAKEYLLDPDRSFLDALTIARKDEISRKWKSAITEATSALKSISALDVEGMDKGEIQAIQSLRDMAVKVLKIHDSVTAKAA
jgi:hypothetical protein